MCFCVGGPEKKCEPKVVVNDFQKPSFAEFSRSLGVQSHPEDSIEQHKVKDGVSYVGGLSPLVPTRLTQRFRNVVSISLFVCPFILFLFILIFHVIFSSDFVCFIVLYSDR